MNIETFVHIQSISKTKFSVFVLPPVDTPATVTMEQPHVSGNAAPLWASPYKVGCTYN